jgi:gamma-glutamyltranspeptidase/glutathione hydrolase
MRRRTFIATLPLAATAALPLSHIKRASADSGDATSPDLPKFQQEGKLKFDRPDVHAGDRPVGASFSSRSAVYGCSGAAGTAQPLATLAAIEILKRGGSAVDAAVTANACLGFLEPTSAGIGGDCFAFIWDPKLNKLVSLAGSGRSPNALTLDIVRSRAKNNAIAPLGAVSVSVPGALDAWWTMHQRYGRLKWAELFEPAMRTRQVMAPRGCCASKVAYLRIHVVV